MVTVYYLGQENLKTWFKSHASDCTMGISYLYYPYINKMFQKSVYWYIYIHSDSGRHGHKRSLSADNILSSPNEDVQLMTPQVVGEVMSKDDPFYAPVGANPFAEYKTYGGKILGYSRNGSSFGFELPSPSFPHTPPCTPIMTPDGTLVRKKRHKVQQTQSLPSSPVLLRKAAEKFHQESLHGSTNCRRNSSVNSKRYSLHFPKSKSATVLPESLAHRLQCELNMEDSEKSTGKGQRGRKYYRQLSADVQRSGSDLGNNSDIVTDDAFQNGGNSESVLFQNSVRDYRVARSSTDSFIPIEEQVADLRNPNMTFITENLGEDCNTTYSSDGAIIETHL